MTRNSKKHGVILCFCMAIVAVSGVVQGAELSDELRRQERLGYYYYGRGDVVTAMQYLLPVAEAGHAMSQYRLGALEEAAANFLQARTWYERAIKQQVWEASHALANLYANGFLERRDLQAAFELELRAAEGGYGPAMIYVGNALEHGVGVEQDLSASVSWYRQAADQGNLTALQRLIKAHRGGELGLVKDETRAAQLAARVEQLQQSFKQQTRERRAADYEEFREIERRYLNGGG